MKPTIKCSLGIRTLKSKVDAGVYVYIPFMITLIIQLV